MNTKKKRFLTVGIISMAIIGMIFLVIQMHQTTRVDTASSDFNPSPGMIAHYEKTYGPGLVNNENTIFPYHKDKIENLKWNAYFEGYGDYVVFGKKGNPNYTSEFFKGLDEKYLDKNKRLYKKMYNIGYKEAKK